MGIEVRAIERAEYETFSKVAMHTFGGEALEGDARDRLLHVLDLKRTYVAFDGADMVGTSGSFSFQLSIPGGRIPMAGLTMVSVRPSHRRQGVMRAMMSAHEEDMRERGEAISGLWASESAIYPRFGYGLAAESYHLEVDSSRLRFLDHLEFDQMRILEIDAAEERLPPIYAACAKARPGMLQRSEAWWKWRSLYDGEDRRGGASSMRIAVARREGRDVGYLLYRQSFAMERGIMAGSARIVELVGLDLQAEASLWNYACHLDLFPTLSWWNAPVDNALPWLVQDRRQVHRSRRDTLWLRLRDVPAALQARRYGFDGSLRISLTEGDAGEAASQYQLSVSDGVGECSHHTGESDLRLSPQSLSSLYLGTFRASELAAAGRLEGGVDAIRLADRLFASALPPWCPEVF